MVKQKEDRRKARAAALATLKSRRSGLHLSEENDTTYSSALDSYNAPVDNVYDDIYDEEEYRRRVESERLKEDFVVDDGECRIVCIICYNIICRQAVECMSRV